MNGRRGKRSADVRMWKGSASSDFLKKVDAWKSDLWTGPDDRRGRNLKWQPPVYPPPRVPHHPGGALGKDGEDQLAFSIKYIGINRGELGILTRRLPCPGPPRIPAEPRDRKARVRPATAKSYHVMQQHPRDTTHVPQERSVSRRPATAMPVARGAVEEDEGLLRRPRKPLGSIPIPARKTEPNSLIALENQDLLPVKPAGSAALSVHGAPKVPSPRKERCWSAQVRGRVPDEGWAQPGMGFTINSQGDSSALSAARDDTTPRTGLATTVMGVELSAARTAAMDISAEVVGDSTTEGGEAAEPAAQHAEEEDRSSHAGSRPASAKSRAGLAVVMPQVDPAQDATLAEDEAAQEQPPAADAGPDAGPEGGEGEAHASEAGAEGGILAALVATDASNQAEGSRGPDESGRMNAKVGRVEIASPPQTARSTGSAPASHRDDDLPCPEIYDRWIVNGAVLAKPLPVVHRKHVVHLDVTQYSQPFAPSGDSGFAEEVGASTLLAAQGPESAEALPEGPRPSSRPSSPAGMGPRAAPPAASEALSEVPTDSVPYLPRMGFSGFKMAKVTRRNGMPLVSGAGGAQESDVFMLKPEDGSPAPAASMQRLDPLPLGYVGSPYADGRTSAAGQRPASRRSVGSRQRTCGRDTPSQRSSSRQSNASAKHAPPAHKPLSRDQGAWVGDTLENVLAKEQEESQPQDSRPYFDQNASAPEDEPYLAFLRAKRSNAPSAPSAQGTRRSSLPSEQDLFYQIAEEMLGDDDHISQGHIDEDIVAS